MKTNIRDIYNHLGEIISDDYVCDIELPTFGTTLLAQLEELQKQLAFYIAERMEL
jgi:hypothetical protein